MNTRFSIKTDGAFLKKISDEPSYKYIRFYIDEPGNDYANNSLLIGTVNGEAKQVLNKIKNGKNHTEKIRFHFDDNDENEVYWMTEDGWHCMITVHNEGNSVIYTCTHPKYKKETSEFVFHKF